MRNTLSTLSTLITDDIMNMSIDQIAKEYKKSLNPALLSLAFKNHYNLIIQTSKNYYGLADEDIASYSLEKLDYCLQTVDLDKALFSTYYTTVLMNKFREETQALNTHKRKAIFYSDSYEKLLDNGFDIAVADFYNTNLLEDLTEYDLTDKEVQYCKLIIKDFTNAEIAKLMDVSKMTLSYIRKSLRLKLYPLVALNIQ